MPPPSSARSRFMSPGQLNLGYRKSVNHSNTSLAKAFSVFSTARRKLGKLSHFSIRSRALLNSDSIALERASWPVRSKIEIKESAHPAARGNAIGKKDCKTSQAKESDCGTDAIGPIPKAEAVKATRPIPKAENVQKLKVRI